MKRVVFPVSVFMLLLSPLSIAAENRSPRDICLEGLGELYTAGGIFAGKSPLNIELPAYRLSRDSRWGPLSWDGQFIYRRKDEIWSVKKSKETGDGIMGELTSVGRAPALMVKHAQLYIISKTFFDMGNEPITAANAKAFDKALQFCEAVSDKVARDAHPDKSGYEVASVLASGLRKKIRAAVPELFKNGPLPRKATEERPSH